MSAKHFPAIARRIAYNTHATWQGAGCLARQRRFQKTGVLRQRREQGRKVDSVTGQDDTQADARIRGARSTPGVIAPVEIMPTAKAAQARAPQARARGESGPLEGAPLETAVFTTETAGRLDKLLADAFPELSRSRLQQVARAGGVSVDGVVVAAPSTKVKAGARITLQIPEAEPARPAPRAIPLDIIHEDDALIVINKAAGMVVHPAAGHHDDTLVNALLAHCGDSLSGIGGVRRPGIVHRLDKDTSGVMVVAKTDQAHQALSAQFADHGRSGPLRRAYLALAWGVPPLPRFTIRKALARSTHNREKIVVVGDDRGREAITHVSTLKSWTTQAQARQATEPVATLLRCELETGRTHQIRVHLASQGHPLLGDALYGSGFMSRAAKLTPAAREALEQLGRQALHAEMLGFAHPVTAAPMRFEAPPPEDLQRLLRALDEAVKKN